MGDVLEFPTQTIQGWAAIERTLREIFRKAAAPLEMQDEVLAQMKEFFQRYNLQFSVGIELCESACNNDPPFGIIGIQN